MTETIPEYIDISELANYQEMENVVFLDVRDKQDFQARHLPNAISIPPNDLPYEVENMDTDKHYIVICYHGVMAVSVMNFMKGHSLKASVLKGGMAAVV